jgi:hypothetical protein
MSLVQSKATSKGIVFEVTDFVGRPASSNLVIMTDEESFVQVLTQGNGCYASGRIQLPNVEYDGEYIYSICKDQAYIYEINNPVWQRWTPQDLNVGEPFQFKDIRFFRLHKGILWIGIHGEGLYYAIDPSGRFYKYDYQPPNLDITAVDFDGNEIWIAAADGNIYHSRIQVRRGARVDSPFRVQNSPASDDRIVLKSNTAQSGTTELSIFAATGQFIKSETLTAGNAWEITVPTAVPGMYFLNLKTSDGDAFTEKWVAGR